MSVRHGLLAILEQGPCYGYQLRQEFSRRTGAAWPLNVGQVYSTLDRLERDGLVTQRDVDAEGHIRYQITAAGSAEAARWFASPASGSERNELATKVALALSLPGADVASIVASQRLASVARLVQPSDVVSAWQREQAEAELRWLDTIEQLGVQAYGLAEATPKRGRPARTPQ